MCAENTIERKCHENKRMRRKLIVKIRKRQLKISKTLNNDEL